MKFVKKDAEYVGYMICHGERINEWICPNRRCGMSVSEEYVRCPYCGQKIKFGEPPKVKMVEIKVKVGELK